MGALLALSNAHAQPKKNTPPSDMNKMMEEALKSSGMSKEEQEKVKAQLAEAQKMLGNSPGSGAMAATGGSSSLRIPPKKTQVLAKIPKLLSADQFTAYLKQLLADCKLKMKSQSVSAAEAALSTNAGSLADKANLAPMFLLQGKEEEAIYCAVSIANANPGDPLIQNNLAVILHQYGYAQKAIPILQYLNSKWKDPVILTSLGECYLTLGDTATARPLFIGAIRLDAKNTDALCGTALILDAGGKPSEAAAYIREALKAGYSLIADELVRKNNIKLKFDDIRQNVPEYFNAQKYKPTPSAKDFDEILPVAAQREALREKVEDLFKKYDAYKTANGAHKDNESVSQVTLRYAGFYSAVTGTGGILSRKAQLMLYTNMMDYLDFMSRYARDNYETLTFARTAYDDMEKEIDKMLKTEDLETAAEVCKRKKEILNNYLAKTYPFRDEQIGRTKYRLYDYVNQSLYWAAFLMNAEEYEEFRLGLLHDFFSQLSGYDNLQQLYPTPQNTAAMYCNGTELEYKKPKTDSLEAWDEDCPLKVEIPIVVAKAKMDCESWEIEGGEGLMGSLEKNYRTGEITIFVGLGAAFYEKGGIIKGVGGGVEGELKGGVFVKFGRDLSVIDCGDKAEVAISGGIGPIIGEAKATGILGMQSGGRLETEILGDKTVIWKTE